jgi:CRP-like cAMP-binding protein
MREDHLACGERAALRHAIAKRIIEQARTEEAPVLAGSSPPTHRWQGEAARSVAGLSVQKLRALLAENPTFNGFDEAQFEGLLAIIKEVRQVDAGDVLVHEGEVAQAIFIVETGRLEVLKKEEDGEQAHRIALLLPGMSAGEIALLDAGARSATVRALEDTRVLVIPIRDLRGIERRLPFDVQMMAALGHELAKRLRKTNEVTVRSLREALREAEIRASMGRTMSRLLIGTTLYIFFVGMIAEIRDQLPSTTVLTVVVLLAYATSVLINNRTSGFPASAYGFTTRNWHAAVIEAVLFSLPVAGLIVIGKAILIRTSPELAGSPLFELRGEALKPGLAILFTVVYVVFVPVQEFIVRSIQSSMMLYLRGWYRVPLAIVISALIFSAMHLHISLAAAITAIPLGLFWGWLYWRNPTLIGVILSHTLLGLFAFRVVGFPGF